MICKNIMMCLVLSSFGSVSTQENNTGEFLLLTQYENNTIYSLDIKTQTLKTLPIRDIYHPYFVSYDTEEDTVYWGEVGGLKSIHIDGTNEKIVRKAQSVAGIAIDVNERLIFYADVWAYEIYKMKIGTQEISTILKTTQCMDIQLDIIDRKMYVICQWLERYRILSANYDGSQLKHITYSFSKVLGLAIDIYDKIIYWSDDKGSVLKSNIDGSHRQLVYDTNTGPTSCQALYKRDTLFFATSHSNYSYIKTIATTGGSIASFGPTFVSAINGLHVVSIDKIDECLWAPCQNGGTCNDLVNGYTCSCAPGYTGTTCATDIDECLSSPCQNGATCNDMLNGYTCSCAPGSTDTTCATGNITSEFLLLADYATSKLYSLDIETQTLKTLPMNVTDLMYISYDTEDEKLYYGGNTGLKSITIDGSNETVIYKGYVRGIAIEPNERLVFFAALYGYILKMKIGTQEVDTAVNYSIGNWAIELDIIDKKIYWSTIDPSNYYICGIYSAYYNGSQMKEIVSGLPLVYSLAIDLKNKLLYWTQDELGIHKSNLDGSNRYIIHLNYESAKWSLALYKGNTLFFTNDYPYSIRSGYVSTISTKGERKSTFGEPIFTHPYGLHVVRTTALGCGSVPMISNGHVQLKIPSNTKYGAEAKVLCDDGYHTSQSTIICRANASWDVPACKALDCGSVPMISNGHVQLKIPPNTKYGAEAKVLCDDGYHTSQSTIICRANASWDVPACKDLPCPLLQLDSNTIAFYTNGTYNGSTASFYCAGGYYLREKYSLVCQGWIWSGQPPSCQNVHFPDTLSEDGRHVAAISGLSAAVAVLSVLSVLSVALVVFIILKLRSRLECAPMCGTCCGPLKIKEPIVTHTDLQMAQYSKTNANATVTELNPSALSGTELEAVQPQYR